MVRAARPTLAMFAATLAVVTLLPPVAAAQHSNGLYEPFPKGAARESAERFVERLPLPEADPRKRLRGARLERGAFVELGRTGLPAGESAGAASSRSGVKGSGRSSLPPMAQIALVAVLIAGLPALAGARPKRRVAAH
jgi:hypothetical protein